MFEGLQQHQPSIIGMEEARKSAVCIPLIQGENGYEVLFQVRSSRIDSQPGDICLPGGMLEPGETPEQAAVRESMEELLIQESQIHMLGALDLLAVGNSMYVYPFAVRLEDYQGTYSLEEVDHVFRVPLEFFLTQEPEVHHVRLQVVPEEDFPYDRIIGGRQYQWRERRDEIYFYQYETYTIWGITAKIMKSFAEMINNETN